ncbi:MAG: trehalose-6-phosphate synthase [Methanobacterium sp. ERen5]|nr:MAG: trehalose-6-phosphate synthase [Methanobacterium sp. ERen5]
MASNRSPIDFYKEYDEIKSKMGSGGLISTLKPLMENLSGTWLSANTNTLNTKVSEEYPNNQVPLTDDNPDFSVKFLDINEQKYEDYYNVISNSILWYVHHNIWKPPEDEEQYIKINNAWNHGYLAVNQEFAKKIVELTELTDKKSLIMLQDYHLYLTPAYIRNKTDNVFLNQFIHVPWPDWDYYSVLPDHMQDSILNGLLSNDLLGFHIPKYVKNFLDCCEGFADSVDYQNCTVRYNGHETMIKSYPISVDTTSLHELSENSEVKKYESLINRIKEDNFLIYRTDRADLSKNIPRGFMAYEALLRNHPEYRGKVKFLVTGKSTREDLDDYKKYREGIELLIERINWIYSTNEWKPIEEIFNAPYELVMAALKNYDCLMVNPLCDGMNIVSKEGPLVNKTDGTMILSEEAGSYEELKNHVIKVDPYDVSETADALYSAVEMNFEKRIKNSNGLKEVIEDNTIYDWILDQFNDISVKF